MRRTLRTLRGSWLALVWVFGSHVKWTNAYRCAKAEAALYELSPAIRDAVADALSFQDQLALERYERLCADLDCPLRAVAPRILHE